MTSLCAAFGVSRKTGYKILNRYLDEGLDGLKDRSRAAHSHPNATSPAVVKEILRLRGKHGWGGQKTVDYLVKQMDPELVPAPSTVDEILRRHGLVKPRRRRRMRSDVKQVRHVSGPNDRWCADFKGWFRTGDGSRCEPLTITDSYSRYLLRCSHPSRTSFEATRPLWERTFRQFGLPCSILTDNGAPFATRGIASLSRLSVWFIRLGIHPDFIEPGRPEQNGRHERMHRTLKAATARPPRTTLSAQQRAFDDFRRFFNAERPHEGIGGKTPGEVYEASNRPFPGRLPELEYPDSFLVRRVSTGGYIKLEGDVVFLGAALRGERVGLESGPDPHLRVHFGPYEIATHNPRSGETLMYRTPRL